MSECIAVECGLPITEPTEYGAWHDACAERAGLALTELIARRPLNTPPSTIGGSSFAACGRRALLDRWGSYCWFCHCILDARTMTKEHLQPKSRGGTDTPDNLRPACRRCNSAKGDMTLDEFVDFCGKITRIHGAAS